MTTPLDIITLALKTIGALGVGQTALAEDANDSFFQLNMMLSQWTQKRYLVYRLFDTGILSTGLAYYTVGDGGDFDIPRPGQIESAFVRFLNNGQDFAADDFSQDFDTNAAGMTDQQLRLILAREDYNRIVQKRLSGVPGYLFYDSDFPLGKIYIWPVPTANLYALHISTRQTLGQFATLYEDIAFPPEYLAALYYNLAVRLAPMYQIDPRPDTMVLAKDALEVLRGTNAQVPTLQMPDALIRPRAYDIYADM